MRYIERIFVHCTASSQAMTIEGLRREFKRRRWKYPGYHYVVKPDGTIVQMLSEDLVSNGVKGYNQTSINVAYIGGIDMRGRAVDNRTEAQKEALLSLLRVLRKKYPRARIMGHRDISPDVNGNGRVDSWERIKECPCFDAMVEYAGV